MPPKQAPRAVRITTTSIQALRVGETPTFLRDSSLKGFQVKKSPNGSAVFQVEARLGGTGNVKKYKIGNVGEIDLTEARTKAQEALGKIRQGIDPLREKRIQLHDGQTLRQLIDDYFSVRNLKPRTQQRYEYLAQTQFNRWLQTRVTDISKQDIRNWYAAGRTKKAMTDAAFRFLNSLMTFAVGSEVIKDNPCSLVTDARMRYPIKSRTKHIEVNYDLPKFLKAFVEFQYLRDSQRVARDAILLILSTGLRHNEACSIQWKNIDFDRGRISIPDTKNHREHIVPLTPLSFGMLNYRKENTEKSKYVFRIKGDSKNGYITSFQKTLNAICSKANIPTVTAHDLRRTFATVLNSIGVGFVDMKVLMNHKSKDITAQYTQPDLENLRRILIRVTNHYDEMIPLDLEDDQFEPYATGALRYKIYGTGQLDLILRKEQDMPEDDEEDRPWW